MVSFMIVSFVDCRVPHRASPRSVRARGGPACGGLERLDEAVRDDLLQPPVLPTRLALATDLQAYPPASTSMTTT
jgi:hypothetical protein